MGKLTLISHERRARNFDWQLPGTFDICETTAFISLVPILAHVLIYPLWFCISDQFLRSLIQNNSRKEDTLLGDFSFHFKNRDRPLTIIQLIFNLTVLDRAKWKQKLLVTTEINAASLQILWVFWNCSKATEMNLGLLGDTLLFLPDTCTQSSEAHCKHCSCQSTNPLQLCFWCQNILLGNSALQPSEAPPWWVLVITEVLGDSPNYGNMLFVTAPLVRVHFIRARKIIKQYGNSEHILQISHIFVGAGRN